jgi:hypothetical protein
VVHVVGASAATVAGCSIVTKVPGLAVVFDDADAITRVTDNDIQGVVSFYGVPASNQRVDVPKLIASLKRPTVRFNAARGRLVMSRNTLEVVTIGRDKFAELTAFTSQTRETLDNLFGTAVFSDNTVLTPLTLFLNAAVSIVGLTLPTNIQAEPLGVFIADSATVSGTVAVHNDSFHLVVLTSRPDRCADAANLPFLTKTT